ncbi:toll/interleukin-1 receptor domain-containing protein [Dactylosporangium salmoneum]|uniref:TIR domain-containing protein n=1 Tax=Dactylosporangium salmoneum TaxID=53361 RepID=A0ABP5V1E4_9ACTN
MGGIFINYRTTDAALGAAVLDDKLVERFGPDAVFRDNRSLPLGKTFEATLWKRLRSSDLVLVVIGPHWLTESTGAGRLIDDPDDFVHREIAEALSLDLDVVPVLIGDTPLPRSGDLPPALRPLAGYQFAQIRARDPEPDMARLVDRLAALPALSALSPRPAATEKREPRAAATEKREPRAAATEKREPRAAEPGHRVRTVKAGRDVIFGDRITNRERGA